MKILGAGTASGTAVSGGTGGVIGAEIRSIAVGVNAATSAVIGGSLSTITTAIQTCDTPTVNAVISGITTAISGGRAAWLAGLISGFTIGVSQGAGHILTEGAIITGGVNGFSSSAGALIMGEIANCASGCTSGGGYTWRGARMSNNTRDLINISNGQAFNTLFGSSTEFSNYNAALRTLIDYVESFDHDQTAGAFRSWTRGGITSSNTGTVYPGRPRSYNAVCESASYPAFFQRQVLVPAGGSVYARCYARKDASMSYLPRVWVFSAEQEPLVSGTPDAEVTMDVADAVDTWEVLEATVTNATDAAKLYTVRMLAKNASGNVYFDPEITVSAGVSRARLVNAA